MEISAKQKWSLEELLLSFYLFLFFIIKTVAAKVEIVIQPYYFQT